MRSLQGPKRACEQKSVLPVATFWITCAVVAFVGCGRSDLGQVTGRVTLDGEPLAGAFVEFVPTGGEGSSSSGRTNERGEL